MILSYALRGVRKHGGVFALLAGTVAVSVALAALLLAAAGSATAAFVARVPPVPLPAPAVAFYLSGGAGYPAQELPTGLGLRLVVAGFPGSPGPGQAVAPRWLAEAAGLRVGDPIVVGGHTFRLSGTYAESWDHALPVVSVGRGSLPLAGKLYAGNDPPPGADWVLRPGTGAAAARADLGAVYSPVDLLVAGVALLGSLGVADTFLLSLLRRRRQLGIARALGWETGQVAVWLLLEAASMAALGALAGWLLAEAAAAAGGLPHPSLTDLLLALLVVSAGLALAARRPAAWLRARTVSELLR
jgi:hypothetical protein